MCEDCAPGRMRRRFVGVFAVDEGIFGALGVKVNSVPGTIDR